MYTTEFPLGNDLLTLELLDTSGTMQFPAMMALHMARGDGFVLVYSVSDPESFEEVRRLREQLLAVRAAGSSTRDGSNSGSDHEGIFTSFASATPFSSFRLHSSYI